MINLALGISTTTLLRRRSFVGRRFPAQGLIFRETSAKTAQNVEEAET